jgi:hypothetical protein
VAAVAEARGGHAVTRRDVHNIERVTKHRAPARRIGTEFGIEHASRVLRVHKFGDARGGQPRARLATVRPHKRLAQTRKRFRHRRAAVARHGHEAPILIH